MWIWIPGAFCLHILQIQCLLNYKLTWLYSLSSATQTFWMKHYRKSTWVSQHYRKSTWVSQNVEDFFQALKLTNWKRQSSVIMEAAQELDITVCTVKVFQPQVSSLTAVRLQKHCALNPLTAWKGRVCVIIGERWCFCISQIGQTVFTL